MANGEISETTENNCIELVKYLMKKYNIDINHIVRHYDASRKICPNWSADNWARWWSFKDKIKNDKLEEQELLVNLKDYFVDEYYKENNPDVLANVNTGTAFTSGLHHYIIIGYKEGRSYSKPKECNGEDSSKKGENFYRVVSGSFKNKKNAEKQLEKLKESGFDGFIDVYNK